tara:strand:+ start:1292 stop:1618 length:327 start_codon:yes stop_codon:yes gene_type:complete
MKEFDMKNHTRKRSSRNNRGRNSRGFNSRKDDKPRRRDSNEMHKVVCDKCSKECEVPFKPSTDKPIYCDDCFKENRDSKERSNGKSRDSSGQLKEMNIKLDKILKLLE